MAKADQERRRPAQKGVQAIFTSDNDRKGYARALVGLLAIGTGAALLTGVFQAFSDSTRVLIPLDIVSSPLVKVSLGMVLVMGGMGLCTNFIAIRSARRENNKKMESAIHDVETSLLPEDNLPYSTAGTGADARLTVGQVSRSRIPKTLAAAIAQSLTLLILYAGLVGEYTSNVNMQTWIRDNFAPGGYLLNYNAVLIIAGLLGVIFFQLLHAR